MLEFLKENWIAISTTIGAIVVWFNERQKRRSEGKIGLNDATEGMQNMYDKFVADANFQYDKLNEKINKLQQSENEAYKLRLELSNTIEDIQKKMKVDKNKIRELESKIAAYEATIKNYESKITDYETQVNKLKQELIKYRKP